jgi:hypothetical protein
VKGNNLEIHHIPQSHPAGQVIPRYDHNSGLAIALPTPEHISIRTQIGTYNGTPRDLLANDLRQLR